MKTKINKFYIQDKYLIIDVNFLEKFQIYIFYY